MSATQPPAKVIPAPTESASDHAYYWRVPSVREALILRVPDRKTTAIGKVTVTEQHQSVLLEVESFNGLSRDLQLTVPEARTVAEHLNKICSRIVRRPKDRP